MKIRFATDKDNEPIGGTLLADVVGREKIGSRGGNATSFVKNDNWNATFVAEVGKKLVGAVKISANSTHGLIEIDEIYVFPNFRRKGFGRKLLQFGETYGAENWPGAFFQLMTINNSIMDNLVKQSGYKRIGTLKNACLRNGRYLPETFWQKKIK